jgi:hypothetical protein
VPVPAIPPIPALPLLPAVPVDPPVPGCPLVPATPPVPPAPPSGVPASPGWQITGPEVVLGHEASEAVSVMVMAPFCVHTKVVVAALVLDNVPDVALQA